MSETGGDTGAGREWERRVGVVVARFFRQNGRLEPDAGATVEFARRLGGVIEARGLPRPLAAGEVGAPGGLPEAEIAWLAGKVAGDAAEPLLADLARQLVKACFYPEFTQCRDSFRELARDGTCRRQELARVRGRVSGTHCVDCPHWVALGPEEHAAMLAAEWKAGPSDFEAHREMFLPEDFRALRRWLYATARR